VLGKSSLTSRKTDGCGTVEAGRKAPQTGISAARQKQVGLMVLSKHLWTVAQSQVCRDDEGSSESGEIGSEIFGVLCVSRCVVVKLNGIKDDEDEEI